jgi:uncharacterized protein YacL
MIHIDRIAEFREPDDDGLTRISKLSTADEWEDWGQPEKMSLSNCLDGNLFLLLGILAAIIALAGSALWAVAVVGATFPIIGAVCAAYAGYKIGHAALKTIMEWED